MVKHRLKRDESPARGFGGGAAMPDCKEDREGRKCEEKSPGDAGLGWSVNESRPCYGLAVTCAYTLFDRIRYVKLLGRGSDMSTRLRAGRSAQDGEGLIK